jgi:AcrR family transcriptional regulator
VTRTADHDARRRQIAGAVGRILAGSGMDAATVSQVAAEAGVSVGLVQHYFQSKDELLLFAYRQAVLDISERVARHIDEGESRRGTIRDIVVTCLNELLPLDETRRAEYRITHAFHGQALDNAALAEVAKETAEDIRTKLREAVTNGTECGEVERHLDSDVAATTMAALVDGLADQLYLDGNRTVGSRTLTDAAQEIVATAVRSVFSGECRHYG